MTSPLFLYSYSPAPSLDCTTPVTSNPLPFLAPRRTTAKTTPRRRKKYHSSGGIASSSCPAPATASTASTLAPLIYRASPIDPTLRLPSPAQARDLPIFATAPSADGRALSPLPPPDHDISRPSSTSTQSSNALRQQQYQQQQNNSNFSLPGLSALASVASAPSPQLRYVGSFRRSLSMLCSCIMAHVPSMRILTELLVIVEAAARDTISPHTSPSHKC